MSAITVTTLGGMPMFYAGLPVADELHAALTRAGMELAPGDIVVVAQKIVSKSEGRTVQLADVLAGDEAKVMAANCDREAELVQLILDESSEILRAAPAAIIARHRTGHVLANAGIDASNVVGGGDGTVLLWPADPDSSARTIRARLRELTGVGAGVIIADSLGRAWRMGTTGAAIGCAGVTVAEDRRGLAQDLYGRTLQATIIAVADALAAMATLAMGEGAEGTPAAIVRGMGQWVSEKDGPGAASGLRPIAGDMFR